MEKVDVSAALGHCARSSVLELLPLGWPPSLPRPLASLPPSLGSLVNGAQSATGRWQGGCALLVGAWGPSHPLSQ